MDQQHRNGKPVPGTPLHRVAEALSGTAVGDDVALMVGDVKDVANACGRNAAKAVAEVRDLVKGKSVGTTIMVSEDIVSDLIDGAMSPQPQAVPLEGDSPDAALKAAPRKRTRKPDTPPAASAATDGESPVEPHVGDSGGE